MSELDNVKKFNSICEVLSENAKTYPDKGCIYFNGVAYTYKETEQMVDKISGIMRKNGLKAGDRAVIYLGNSPEYIFAYFAIIKAGGIVVPTNSFLKAFELATNMNDCGAEFIVTSSAFEGIIKELPALVPGLKTVFTFEDVNFPAVNIYKEEAYDQPSAHKPSRDDVAALIYTSGTTGKPKGVMLTHTNLMTNGFACKHALQPIPEDVFVALLPMFHSYSYMTAVILPIVCASEILVFESIMDTAKEVYRDALIKKRPTVLLGIPQLYSAMAKKKVMDRIPFRLCVSGGAALPMDTLEAFKNTYGVAIREGYGLSEASPVVAFNPNYKQKAGTVGQALIGIETKVVDENGKILGVNEAGELCIKADSVMKGYWNQPEETALVLKEGWLHTGDIAKIDEEGFISIVDRIKDLILVKGMNVYPREIEELLYHHPSVQMAAVVGVPEKDGNEMIVAYVKIDPEKPVTEAELKEYTKKNLANFKLPKIFVMTDNMPMNSNGKILKRELKEIAIKEFGA